LRVDCVQASLVLPELGFEWTSKHCRGKVGYKRHSGL
jgi:hypothetical protein